MELRLFSLAFAAWLAVSAPARAASWPDLLNYQGQLTDALDNAVSDGSYSVLFSLYTVPGGGVPFWAETQAVNTSKGLFTVVLGSSVPLSGLLLANSASDLWISLKVGSDLEMAPRQQLLPAVYATHALDSDTLGGRPLGIAAFNVVQLDAAAMIPPGTVASSSLAPPLSLTGSAAPFLLSVTNSSALAGAYAATIYQGGGGSAVNAAVYASANSTKGRAFQALAQDTNFYSDAAARPLYGFFHNDLNSIPAAIGVFSRSSCTDCTAGYFYNSSATTGAGAALYVNGRMALPLTSGSFTTGNNVSSFTLTNSYIRSAANTTIILTPLSNITPSWWISSIGAVTNQAVISFALNVSNVSFQYSIMGK